MQRNKFQESLLLLKLKTKRDPDTYAEVYDLYVERIYRFIYFKVSVTEDVEDLTSEVFLKTWHYVNKNETIKNFNALIYQVARNLVIDYYRKKSKSDVVVEDQLLQNTEDSRAKRDQQAFFSEMDMVYIHSLLDKLKDDYREVILLKHIEHYSLKEIALILDKSVGSVKVLLHRAMKRVQNLHNEVSSS